MGMDVYGKNATSEKGEYFRNNIWWWRPLWNYCVEVAPELCADIEGHSNSGDGLDRIGATALSDILFEELQNGRTVQYEQDYYARLAVLPRNDCQFCGATGIRTDKIGTGMGQPNKELSPEVQVLTGRTHGWCNGCDGVGTVESERLSYPFTADNVQEFAEFLSDCGGFSIC